MITLAEEHSVWKEGVTVPVFVSVMCVSVSARECEVHFCGIPSINYQHSKVIARFHKRV